MFVFHLAVHHTFSLLCTDQAQTMLAVCISDELGRILESIVALSTPIVLAGDVNVRLD